MTTFFLEEIAVLINLQVVDHSVSTLTAEERIKLMKKRFLLEAKLKGNIRSARDYTANILKGPVQLLHLQTHAKLAYKLLAVSLPLSSTSTE